MKAGVYIHVPFCAVKCPYCDFYAESYTKQAMEQYVHAVCRNVQALPEHLPADTVYFGGGTPSLLPINAICSIMEAIQNRCDLSPDAEITLEANPLTMTAEKMKGWLCAGVNRLSVGMQSFRKTVLQQLGRRHTPEQAEAAVLLAHEIGFQNISIDLMFGLSAQTEEIWQKDLEKAISLPISHISSYMLKIEENTPFFTKSPDLSDDDAYAERYLQMHQFLTENGFFHYEISNFAKKGYESRHNCKYWRCAPYYGIGPAAHSCYGGKRYAVPRDLSDFCSRPLQTMHVTEPAAGTESERLMLGMRLAEGVTLSDLPQIGSAVLQQAEPFIPRFLLHQKDRLCMTPDGWLVSNALLVQLMMDGERAEVHDDT
ncbi:MAG TPA: coproporphyrinogen III oxidase [Ruminococcus sp.]|nr:coproporphyrinogen III oxidase [Ruminococcus sp.]